MDQNATETTQSDVDKVIARIQKLLSRTKTERGTTEAEADTAMKMAQELMAKHNLDMAVVEAASASKEGATAVERVKEQIKGRAMYKWQRQLAKYVAEANFCYHLIKTDQQWVNAYYKLDKDAPADNEGKPLAKTLTREEWSALPYVYEQHYTRVEGRYKTTHSHIFVGRKSNVITAQLMYQYLTQTIEDLVPIEDNNQRLSRSAMSWKEGCADRLCERLAKRRRDLISAHDARVKQEQADREAENKQRAEDARKAAANKPKPLAPHHESEVKAAFEGASAGAYDRVGTAEEAEETERPEVDESDAPWVPQGEEVPEPEAGTALVLASVYDESEREANWEIAHGWEPGSLAKWRAEREEEKRKRAEEEAKAEVDEVEKPVKEETERQRRARERREQQELLKQRRRWAREDEAAWRREQREMERRDHNAYKAGLRKGDDIGIDTQISRNSDSTRKLT